jgi:hypothetical protein
VGCVVLGFGDSDIKELRVMKMEEMGERDGWGR